MNPTPLQIRQYLATFMATRTAGASQEPPRQTTPAPLPLPVFPSTVAQRTCNPSLGLLDKFPADVLVMVLDYLDVQSLSRMSQACMEAKHIIEQKPAYADLLRHAPQALAALSKDGLLGLHSAAALHQTLLSKECVSCGGFGEFLLELTCERACRECTSRNVALKAIRPVDAQVAFALTEAQLKDNIPIMKTKKASLYDFKTGTFRTYSAFVNVAQAKKLALKVHGSVEALEHAASSTKLPDIGRSANWLKSVRGAPLEAPLTDMSRMPQPPIEHLDTACGMGNTSFPFLSPAGTAEAGCICEGCKALYSHFLKGMLPRGVARALGRPLANPSEPLRAAASRLHTNDGLQEHIKRCYGVRRILPQNPPTQ